MQQTLYLGLALADWFVLAVYFVGILGIGIWSMKKVSDMSDFFMGGRRFGKVFMMFFAFGSGTSSEQAVSVASGSFRFGLAGIWYQFLWLWATPFYWIVAPVFRRMRALTTSDFFQSRYDTSTATLYSCIGMINAIVFISGALYGAGRMIEGLAGGINPATGEPFFPMSYAVAAMTVLFVLYGAAGGLGAAIITDFVQGVLTILFSFLLLPFVLNAAAEVTGAPNGFAAIHQGVPGRTGEQLTSLTLTADVARSMGQEPITLFYIVMLSLSGLIGIVVQPHIMGVCGAGKTEFEGRVGFTFGNFIKRACTVAWSFTGLACVIMYLTPGTPFLSPEQFAAVHASPEATAKFADRVFGLAAHDLLPNVLPGLVGLLMASLLAAVMSSCDAQMVVASGLFTENIYRRFLWPNQSQRHYLWVGRISGVVIVCLALALMTQFENVIQVLTRYIQAIPTFMGLAFWFGITWRRYTPAAVWTSTLTTAGTWYLTQSHTPLAFLSKGAAGPLMQYNVDYLPRLVRFWLHDHFPWMTVEKLSDGELVNVSLSVPWQMLIYLGTGALAGIVVSLLSRPVSREKLDHFFRLLRTPVRPDEHVSEPCTLPDNPLPEETDKLIDAFGLEIPRPSRVGLLGFLGAWVVVALIVLITRWLAGLGAG